MIQLSAVNKSYGNLKVLSDVSLSIPEGKITAIVGPSGAGKTTLLRIAGSLDRPDSGSITYDGTEITGFKDRRLSEFRCNNIGFIFQFHELLPEFSARENVAMPAMIAGLSRKNALEKADNLLRMLGLGERLHHKPAELSGGERQRTAIARALVNQPKVILADEPTGSLDSHNRDEIQHLIASLCKEHGQTFLMVTHDPSLTSIAHHVVTMQDGRIVDVTETCVETC